MKKTGFYAITAAAVWPLREPLHFLPRQPRIHTWLRRAVWPPFFPSLPRR